MASDKEIVVGEDVILVSKTDKNGKIVYANQEFMTIVGYDETSLMEKPHNIVRHPDMPRVIFKMLWSYLQNGKEIHAYVKNITKDGSFYWVLANVFPVFDLEQNIVGYHSSRRKPNPKALEIIKPLYQTLIGIEREENMEKSERYLNELLASRRMEYDEFILSV